MSNELKVPSVGRIVHFRKGDALLAAIVTHVWTDEMVNLTVFLAGGLTEPQTSVSAGEGERQWQWPAYVPPFKFPAEVEHLAR